MTTITRFLALALLLVSGAAQAQVLGGPVVGGGSGGGGGVSSFSAGTTGLTPSSTTTGAVTLAGDLTVANGGTGQTTIVSARQALAFPNINNAIHAEGDSITVGTAASPLSLGYAGLLSTDTYSTLTNEGVTSQQGCDIADTQTFANEQPVETGNPTYTLLEGTNDAFAKGAGSYEAVYNGCMKAQLTWMTVPSTYKVLGNSSGCVQAGTWAADSRYHAAGVTSSTNASTLTCTITTYGGPLYAWYREVDSNGGTFTYAVDGGSTTSVSTATTPAIATQLSGTAGDNVIRVPSLAAGSHTIVFTVTSSTSGSNTVDIIGTGTPSPTPQWQAPLLVAGGVLYQQGDTQSADTAAYNLDNKNNVAAADADGLNVFFVDVRKYLNFSSTNMTGLHPTTAGHRLLANAFEAVMQPTTVIPNPILNSLTVNGPGTNAFGSAAVLIQTNSSEAGIHINNTGTNGREYGIYATANGSGLGAGLFDIIDVTSGTTDLSFNSSHTATFPAPIVTGGYNVSTLPSGTKGMRSYVNDQLTACVVAGSALTGGGSVVCPVFYNGSAWVGD